MNIWQETLPYLIPIFTLFGGIATVGTVIAATAFGIVKLFGEKWLQAKFDKQLAAYKHQQQKELAELKFKIDRLTDRATKFHEREFEVIPEAWAQLSELYARAVDFVSPSHTHPNLDDMTPEHLEDFIAHCELRDWQKEEIRKASTKTAHYIKNIFWHQLSDIKKNQQNCHLCVLKNSIIIPENIRDKFNKIQKLISTAIIEKEHNHTIPPHPQIFVDIRKLSEEGSSLISELEKAIENRLATLENFKF
jgi:hypothetical protein